MQDNKKKITPDMTVLDIVSTYRETEKVFKKYDEMAGECICCNSLFDPLAKVSDKYHIDLNDLLEDLMNVK